MHPGPEDLDLVVVGGGLTGCLYALARLQAGDRVRLLEAEGELLRSWRTEVLDGRRVEPRLPVVGTADVRWSRLVGALPAPLALAEPPRRLTPAGLWSRRGLGVPRRGDFRLRVADLAARGRRAPPSPRDLARWAGQRLGRHAAWAHVAPAARATYGAHPGVLGAGDAFPALVAAVSRRGSAGLFSAPPHPLLDPAPRTLAGGNAALASALVDALGDVVRTGQRAALLGTDDAGGPVVRLAGGERVAARRVALAVAPSEQARLLAEVDPGAADVLAATARSPLVALTMGLSPRDAARLPVAPGFLVAPQARARCHAVVLLSRLDPHGAPAGEGLVWAWYGGARDPGAIDLGDDVLAGCLAADLGRALGRPIEPTFVALRRSPDAVSVPRPRHAGAVAALQALLDARGVVLLGDQRAGPHLLDAASLASLALGDLPAGLAPA